MFAGSNLKGIRNAGRPTKKVSCLQNTNKRDEAAVIRAIKKNPKRLIGQRVFRTVEVENTLVHHYGIVHGEAITPQNKNNIIYHVEMDTGNNELWSLSKIWKNRVM